MRIGVDKKIKPVVTRLLVRPDVLDDIPRATEALDSPLEFAAGVEVVPCKWLAAPWIALMSDGSIRTGDSLCE